MFKRPVVALPVFKPELCHSSLTLGCQPLRATVPGAVEIPPKTCSGACKPVWRQNLQSLWSQRSRVQNGFRALWVGPCRRQGNAPGPGKFIPGILKKGTMFSRSFRSRSVTRQPWGEWCARWAEWPICQVPVSFATWTRALCSSWARAMLSVCLGWALDFGVNWSIILR